MIQGMLGAFRELDAAVDAIEALKKDRTGEITVYTPTPRHELEHAVHPPVSPVRKFTLAGGLFGAIAGYWIAIWCSEYWPLVVGGKAISTWIPYTVFSFELMVLIGGLSTVAGMFICAGIPRPCRRNVRPAERTRLFTQGSAPRRSNRLFLRFFQLQLYAAWMRIR